MPSVEMLKKLLDEFVEKQALIDEEMKVVVDQIQQLEMRLETCRSRLSTIGADRQKVLTIRERYFEGNFLADVNALKAGMDAVSAAVSRHSSSATAESSAPATSAAASPAPAAVSTPTPAPMATPAISSAPSISPVISASTTPLASTIPPAPAVHTPEPVAHTPEPPAHTPEPVAYTPEPAPEPTPEPPYVAPQPNLNDYLSNDFSEPSSPSEAGGLTKALADSGTHPVLKDSGAHAAILDESAPPPPTPLTTITGLNALLSKRNAGAGADVPLTQPLPPAPSNTVNTQKDEPQASGYGLLDRFADEPSNDEPEAAYEEASADANTAAPVVAQDEPQQQQQQSDNDGNAIVDLGSEEAADDNDTVKSINDALRSLFR